MALISADRPTASSQLLHESLLSDRASRHARPSPRGAVAPGMHSSRRSHPHKSAQEVARSSSECAKSCPRHRCSIILEEGRPRGVGGGWLHIKIVCRMCTLPRGTGYRVFHSCQQASAKKCGFVVAGGARSAFQQGSTLYSVFQRILLYSAATSTCAAVTRPPLYAYY